MAFAATVYKVLIASPSDVGLERNIARDMLHAWSDVNSELHGVVFQPVGWEFHSVPEMGGRPQAIINKQLTNKCDVLIGLFWSRIGTHSGVEVSGTVEEIKEFMEAGKRVLLYFSTKPIPQPVDHGQGEKLEEFKKWCFSEGLVAEFATDEELRSKLNLALGALAIDLRPTTSYDEALTAVTSDVSSKSAEQRKFMDNFTQFLRRLKIEWVAERDSEPNNVDVGKNILDRCFDQVADIRAQVVKGDVVMEALDACLVELKRLGRIQLLADGRKSWNEFWDGGDRMFAELERIKGVIEDAFNVEGTE